MDRAQDCGSWGRWFESTRAHEVIIETFPVGAFACNCTILADEKSGDAIVIDPGDEYERIQGILQKHNLTPKYIFHTHAHIDHIAATYALKAQTSAKIFLHKDDLFLFKNIKMQAAALKLLAPGMMKGFPSTPAVDTFLEHNDAIDLGAWGGKIIHTPGHTPGSLTFYFPDMDGHPVVFTGDTLFQSSIGRTDLWGGSFEQIMASIKERLLILPGETRVITGHGPETTIGFEKQTNPFVLGC